MGLLEGLESLRGAPPPSRAGTDPLAAFGNGAQSFFEKLGGGVDALGDGVKDGVNSLRRIVTDEPADDLEAPAQQSVAAEMSQLFELTLFQRIALFGMCFATGIVLIFISFSFLPIIMLVPHKFVAAFTMGNVLAIVSTWFLVGPRAQLATLFHPIRAAAAAAYFGSLLFALFAAFFGGKLRYMFVLAALIAEVGSCTFDVLQHLLSVSQCQQFDIDCSFCSLLSLLSVVRSAVAEPFVCPVRTAVNFTSGRRWELVAIPPPDAKRSTPLVVRWKNLSDCIVHQDLRIV
jgi:Got1/Sft2-like family